jgi:chromosome segregation protein
VFLRSLKLRGFKSFPEAVEVRLEPGVAVVVGPNGSGKSNVADAIVWAAGSLSPTELRAEKPDDVIYAGSGSEGPADWCQVELIFDNEDGDGPLPYSEVSIARRLHRGGEGQYLVNGASVRRLDLVELLADIGLGGEMHSIIGQGRVEQILASKPAERRALIEEAAGLGKFKRRRHRAELKLARVAVQVERSRDLEEEVKKRLRPLALQASAATRAEKLGDELERLQARLTAGELADAESRLAEVEERRAAAVGGRRAREERLEAVLAERHRVEEELGEAGARHERATAALYRHRTAVERLDLRRERAEESVAALGAEAERARRLAEAPRDDTPLEELAATEAAATEAAERTRAAIAERESLQARAGLAEERLLALERSLAEGEGLPPAARVLVDAGARLALTSLDIEPGYDRAVAAALAWRASAVVAESLDAGVGLLERVRSEGLGNVAVLVPAAAEGTEWPEAPVPGAEPLSGFARPLAGAERVAALLAGVWVAEPGDFERAEHGILVSREGHGYDPLRGELWFAGQAAESVLLGLHTRRKSLQTETAALAAGAEQASVAAAGAAEEERRVRERVDVARRAVGRMPARVDPRDVDHLEGLANEAARLLDLLTRARGLAGRFEPALRARADAGGTRTAELGEELRRLGASEAELRRAASEAGEAAAAIAVEAARLEAEVNELRGRLPEDTGPESLTDEETAELGTTVERLERRREQLGQVNPLAAEEHARESERLADLRAQREDLERSLVELERVRDELTETVETRFAETYAAVERHFAEVAGTLFPGGNGRLLAVEPNDGEEAGVELELQPAGKKITRLSLLSGGEKALGAISFLFALFLARPCPFYLLDEVEAALDDTNIGRFVELLRRYADRAQFVVVTHQKRTMEAADILYGVTMGADGVSQIVSKRLVAEPAHALSA